LLENNHRENHTHIIVDISDGLSLQPTLRLVRNTQNALLQQVAGANERRSASTSRAANAKFYLHPWPSGQIYLRKQMN
jgi:hypothetical protein